MAVTVAREPFNPDRINVPKEERTTATHSPLTVSQITAQIKQAIETSLPRTVHVVGEISNFKRHSSGHLYLTLKDDACELSCVMWRSAAAKLKFDPTDGMEIVATGSIEVFERAGRYQLYIRKVEPRGVGALELAFRQLCEKLQREGLFDEVHKRPLPRYPQRIVLITSPTGAAVADMLRTISRRYPCVHTLIDPVRVQGPGAAAEIAAAIGRVNARADDLGGVDLIIVGRGGGSLEDLWAFNEERVARAIHASRIPIISAVGHEVDVTVADLVADVRAATPTAAAELAVPVLDEILADVADLTTRLLRSVRTRLDLVTARLSGTLQRNVFREPLTVVHRREQVIDELTGRMHRAIVERIHRHRRSLDRCEPVIERIAPHALLSRQTVALRDIQHRLEWAILSRTGRAERRIDAVLRRLLRASPADQLPRLEEHVEHVTAALRALLGHRLSTLRHDVRRREEVLAAMSYKSVLGRGFSITRTKKKRRVVRSLGDLHDGERLISELADGEFESQVVNLNQLELFG